MSDITLFGNGFGELDQVSRSTQRALDQIHEHGLMAGAMIDAVGYAGRRGLQEIGGLSMDEALLVERMPHAGPRAKAVVDNCTAAIIGIVARMGYRS